MARVGRAPAPRCNGAMLPALADDPQMRSYHHNLIVLHATG
jgi:hypothetical protein